LGNLNPTIVSLAKYFTSWIIVVNNTRDVRCVLFILKPFKFGILVHCKGYTNSKKSLITRHNVFFDMLSRVRFNYAPQTSPQMAIYRELLHLFMQTLHNLCKLYFKIQFMTLRNHITKTNRLLLFKEMGLITVYFENRKE
jgi:hypothetical protein